MYPAKPLEPVRGAKRLATARVEASHPAVLDTIADTSMTLSGLEPLALSPSDRAGLAGPGFVLFCCCCWGILQETLPFEDSYL